MIAIVAGYHEQDIKQVIEYFIKRDGRRVLSRDDIGPSLRNGNLVLDTDDKAIDPRETDTTESIELKHIMFLEARFRSLDVYIPILIDIYGWMHKVDAQTQLSAEFRVEQVPPGGGKTLLFIIMSMITNKSTPLAIPNKAKA